MATVTRVIVIVLDSVGVGFLPDAAEYGDHGADTLGHIAARRDGLHLPTLQRLGLGNIVPLTGIPPCPSPLAGFGRMAERAKGKDTVAGHWELMGVVLETPFALFPQGFSAEFIAEFCRAAGVAGVLGNKAASGTEIIAELGAEHMRSGMPIVYTSADSVFQIAAHEQVIPLERLYEICKIARTLCDSRQIGRVIARPFIGTPGAFTRTANRHDYPMLPPRSTAMDILKSHGVTVTGIGKIETIFAGRGLHRSFHIVDNADGMRRLQDEIDQGTPGFVFANLVDFDMVYGHRNDVDGYAAALEAFDAGLAGMLPTLGPGDILIITADHGCDPTYPGTDHTREYVPLLAYRPGARPGALGVRSSFADVGATVLEAFAVAHDLPGESFLSALKYTSQAGTP